jgi:hypothetical protein
MSENEDGRDPKTGRFLPGSQHGPGRPFETVHGGESAVKSIQRGEPLRGLAAKEEQSVQADYATAGRLALVEENAIRLQTAARLYWSAVEMAADSGDLERLDSYIARFGWLAGASLRAWAEVRREQKNSPPALDYEELVRELRGEG